MRPTDVSRDCSAVPHCHQATLSVPVLRAGAFTLIEILVALAIIVLLVGLLVPVLGMARRSALHAQCVHNLKQLGMATMLYTREHDESFWQYRVSHSPEPGTTWWFGYEDANGGSTNRPLDLTRSVFAPYLDAADQRLHCPVFPHDHPDYDPKFDKRAATYGYNWRLSGLREIGAFVLPDQTIEPHRISRYRNRLSEVFVFADGVFFEPGSKFNEGFYIDWQSNIATLSGYAHFRHMGKANVLFMDGHVNSQSLDGPSHRTVGGSESGNLVALDGSNAIYGTTP